jgi:hypothetical protein
MTMPLSILNLWRKPSAPKLRNKPGGMAWIVGIDHGNGIESLQGRAVKTVRLEPGSSRWEIDPPQRVKFTKDTLYTFTHKHQDVLVLAGEYRTVSGLGDAFLEPWKEDEDGVSREEVRELFSPKSAEKTKERV